LQCEKPITELDKRLDENDNPLPGFEPYNQIDKIAIHHDIKYRKAYEGIGTRHEADNVMLDELKALKTKGNWEKIDYAIVKPIIWLKHKRGLGFDPFLAEELLKPIAHKFKRWRVFVYNIDDIWSAELKDMQCIKTKQSFQILLTAFKKLFKTRKPNKLWTDQGSEFINRNFNKFLEQNNIEFNITKQMWLNDLTQL